MTAAVSIRQVRRHFAAHVDEYDAHALVQKQVVADLIGRLPAALHPFAPALDLGTGTGDLALKIRERAPTLTLLVSDLAHAMTCCAASRVPGVLALDADAESLPLRDACVGLVLSASMYQWVNDLNQAFAEVHRVLKPGGLFAFALFGAGTLRELRVAHDAALAECGVAAKSHMQRFPERETVAVALEQAGLTAQLACCDEVEEHPDAVQLLRKLKRIGAQNAAEDRPRGLAGRAVMQRMTAIYTERFGRNGVVPATYEVIYGLARKKEAG